jgi:chemotaxis response regulator CheB
MNRKQQPGNIPSSAEAEGKRGSAEEGSEKGRGMAGTVVGIGSSAGGFEAFRLLLAHVPPNTGFAVVLVQHLDAKDYSVLLKILGRTAQMPVSEASDGAAIEPNRIYVMPPNAELTIANRILRLTPRVQMPGPRMPIDQFLRSLAHDCGRRAVGVVLSGAGIDGSAGLQAIKEEGGVTFTQDPATAEFASIPEMAVAATCVDFVLPPDRIAAELVRIAHHPYYADTMFKISLPAMPENLDRTGRAAYCLAQAPKGSSEVILLVEDEDMVRNLARRILEASGYVVLEARNGLEGLSLCEAHQGPIDLLFSDVVMPELGGRDLAERASTIRPGMKVLFMSGQTEEVILKDGITKGVPFLQKPFTPVELAYKVREVFDA